MRRFWGLFLVAAGVFALVLGLLVKFYAEPRVVRVALDQRSSTQSVSDGQSVVLDAGTGKLREGLKLVANREVRGIVDGSKDDRIAVWHTGNALVDSASGDKINVDDETVAFDRVTAEAVNCCGEQLNGDQSVRHSGLLFKFPFGTQKKTYQYWDTTAKKAFPAVFVGTDTRDVIDKGTKVGDLQVYHFRSTIDPTPLTTGPVPPSYVGRAGDQPLQLTTTYSNVRDLWVEPVTGEIVDGREHPKQTLRDASGQDLATAFDTNIGYTEATRDAAAVTASNDAKNIQFVGTLLPLILIVLGPLLLLAGLALLYLRGAPAAEGAASSGPGGRHVDEGTVVDLRDGIADVTTVDAPRAPADPQPGPA